MSDHPWLPAEHTIKIRDLRTRFGEPEVYAAECSCGWTGEPQRGSGAERTARREGIVHVDERREAAERPR